MLVEFKVSNFRSFKEEVIFSMEPASQNGKNYNIIETGFKKIPQLFRTSGIFGANASGKSNLLLACKFINFLVLKSSDFKKDNSFPQEYYALNDENINLPMQFEIQFVVNNNLYKYNFAILKNIVQKESLYYYPIAEGMSGKPNRVFDRENINNVISFDKAKGILQSWSNETLDNRLFLSEIVNNRKCEITEVLDVYDWITKNLTALDTHEINSAFSLKKILEGEGQGIIDLMEIADLGLKGITVEKISTDDLLERVKANEKEIDASMMKDIMNGKLFAFNAKSIHQTENGLLKEFDFDKMESVGTRRFLSLTGPILDILEKGKVLVIDELDSALHPHLVKHLVSIFNNSETNPNNAQLIFASHAHYLMDGEHLTRDQIWFTSKENNNGFYSDLYSLSDLKTKEARKNISFYDAYMNGIYGAVPFLENI